MKDLILTITASALTGLIIKADYGEIDFKWSLIPLSILIFTLIFYRNK